MCVENDASLSVGAAVVITAVMEGLILVTVFGLLLILVFSCAKRDHTFKRNGELITHSYCTEINVVWSNTFLSN